MVISYHLFITLVISLGWPVVNAAFKLLVVGSAAALVESSGLLFIVPGSQRPPVGFHALLLFFETPAETNMDGGKVSIQSDLQ